jgi:hypothetical protein
MEDTLLTAQGGIPLKYVGDTGVQLIPCTVSDMIDQGVQICDGRYSDEEVWEGQGIIISPCVPDYTSNPCIMDVYYFTDPLLSPADPRYEGQLATYFSINRAHIRLETYPATL